MNPVQISYRHVEASEALSACIEAEYALLSGRSELPFSCRVTVEGNRHTEMPRLHVKVELDLEGKTLIASRPPTLDGPSDPYLEVRHAFHAIERQLEKYSDQHAPRSGPKVVTHAPTGSRNVGGR